MPDSNTPIPTSSGRTPTYQTILSGLVVAVMGLLSWLVKDNSSYIETLHTALAKERKEFLEESRADRKEAKEERQSTWKEVAAFRVTMDAALSEIRGTRRVVERTEATADKLEKTATKTEKAVADVKKAVSDPQ